MNKTWTKYTEEYPRLAFGHNKNVPGVKEGDKVLIPSGTMVINIPSLGSKYPIAEKNPQGFEMRKSDKDQIVVIQGIHHGFTSQGPNTDTVPAEISWADNKYGSHNGPIFFYVDINDIMFLTDVDVFPFQVQFHNQTLERNPMPNLDWAGYFFKSEDGTFLINVLVKHYAQLQEFHALVELTYANKGSIHTQTNGKGTTPEEAIKDAEGLTMKELKTIQRSKFAGDIKIPAKAFIDLFDQK